MAQTLKFGNGTWATKKGSTLAYNDLGGNFKPLPFTYTGAGKGTRVNKEGLIEVVENDRPRIDYKDSEDGVFLLEKASTNLFTQSETLSNWTNSQSTKTINASISPNGSKTATKVIPTTSTSVWAGLNSQNISITSGTTYTFSVFAKKEEYSYIQVGGSTPRFNASFSTIDLSNGTVIYESGITANVESYDNDWYRISYNQTAISSGSGLVGFIAVYNYPPNSRLQAFGGNGTSGVYIWGAQVETENLSSYIPTQGSATTRVAETASDSGNSEVFNDSEGVLFADIAANADDSSERFLSLSNGSSTNRISLWYYSATNGLAVAIYSSNVTQFFTTTVLPKDTLYNKISVKYKQNDFSLWVNGFEIATDTSGNTPIGLSELSFDRGDGALDFYGKTKEIAYYDTVLTDLELETLTSYRSWEEMVKELNLNIIHNE